MSCTKVTYTTQTQARDAARGIARNTRQSMHAYQCAECGLWHLHSSSKGKKLRPPKKDKWRWDGQRYGSKKY